MFQCSSASRKFLNTSRPVSVMYILGFSALQRAENSSMSSRRPAKPVKPRRFSALQRAENSSMCAMSAVPEEPRSFQCSSASRKFLNRMRRIKNYYVCVTFQCSSASRKFLNIPLRALVARPSSVSVLFSEPKIPQLPPPSPAHPLFDHVSVLFSEPKIPQSSAPGGGAPSGACFSALQRAENSSMVDDCRR